MPIGLNVKNPKLIMIKVHEGNIVMALYILYCYGM